MSYRAKVYFAWTDADDKGWLEAANTTTLVSEAYSDKHDAELVLESLLKTASITGGHLEVKVPNIGWVVDGEEETAIICYRRNESERMTGTDMLAENAHLEELVGLRERQELPDTAPLGQASKTDPLGDIFFDSQS